MVRNMGSMPPPPGASGRLEALNPSIVIYCYPRTSALWIGAAVQPTLTLQHHRLHELGMIHAFCGPSQFSTLSSSTELEDNIKSWLCRRFSLNGMEVLDYMNLHNLPGGLRGRRNKQWAQPLIPVPQSFQRARLVFATLQVASAWNNTRHLWTFTVFNTLVINRAWKTTLKFGCPCNSSVLVRSLHGGMEVLEYMISHNLPEWMEIFLTSITSQDLTAITDQDQ